MKTIDCRAMTCPLPVVTVKRALEEPETDELCVLLDDGPPRENVIRFARSHGYEVSEQVSADGVTIVINGSDVARTERSPVSVVGGKRVILVSSDRLGEGPEELGLLLMKNFFITLLECAEFPKRIFFVNRGVFLAIEGSELLEALQKLGNRGVEILSCGVCLDYFGKREMLAVGSVTNMFSIVEALMSEGGGISL